MAAEQKDLLYYIFIVSIIILLVFLVIALIKGI